MLETRTETRSQSTNTITIDYAPRCLACNRVLLGIATRPWQQECPRCKKVNSAGKLETR